MPTERDHIRARVTLAAKLQLPIPAMWPDVIRAVDALLDERTRLRKHVEDLNHDFESSNKFCDEHHREYR